MQKNYVYKRGNKYQYRRRVPSHMVHLDPRKEVVISLKTGNEKEALIRASIYNDQMETYWRSLVQSGQFDQSGAKYKAAVNIARAHGFIYKTTEEVAASTLNEIVERLSVDLPVETKAEALLGGAEVPQLRLDAISNLYFDLVQDRLLNKSDHKITKWKNPRCAAMREFIEVSGNLLIQDVERSTILEFKSWLNTKISTGLSPDTANKKLRFVKDMLKVVSIHHEIDLDIASLFAETRFYYEVQSRPPFKASFVQDTLLKSLSKLNERDSHVIMAMADTGARVVEIFGLLPEDIILDAEIPHIWIRSRPGYALKTRHSERKIPLVGTALQAFKAFPRGFSHDGNPDVFSTIVNKYLTEHDLRPTPQHSIYSLRHTFKDRLRDYGENGAPEEVIDELMGHKKPGVHYGRGHKLETKARILQKIAFSR